MLLWGLLKSRCGCACVIFLDKNTNECLSYGYFEDFIVGGGVKKSIKRISLLLYIIALA